MLHLEFDDDGASYSIHGVIIYQSELHLARAVQRRVYLDDDADELLFHRDHNDDDDDDDAEPDRRTYGQPFSDRQSRCSRI